MKKLLVLFFLTPLSLTLLAQGELVSKYFERYANNEDFVKVSISSKMFSLFTELEAGSEDEKEFLKAVSKLKGMKMVMADSISGADKIYREALADVDKAGYDELITIMDAEENLRFSIKEKGGIIEELLMVVGGKKRFVLLSIFGEIDLNNISKIARSMSIEGFSHLKNLDNKDNDN